MKSEFFRVNLDTGEYTEKVILDIDDDKSETPKCEGKESSDEERD